MALPDGVEAALRLADAVPWRTGRVGNTWDEYVTAPGDGIGIADIDALIALRYSERTWRGPLADLQFVGFPSAVRNHDLPVPPEGREARWQAERARWRALGYPPPGANSEQLAPLTACAATAFMTTWRRNHDHDRRMYGFAAETPHPRPASDGYRSRMRLKAKQAAFERRQEQDGML